MKMLQEYIYQMVMLLYEFNMDWKLRKVVLKPYNAWAILPTNNKGAVRGDNNDIFGIFFILASATKSWEK